MANKSSRSKKSAAPAKRKAASARSQAKSGGGARRKSSVRSRSKRTASWLPWKKLILVALVALISLVIYLDAWVQSKFAGKKWALPAQVYARPLELYESLKVTEPQLLTELKAIGYRNGSGPGSWRRINGRIELHTSGFEFWDGKEPATRLRLRFSGNQLVSLTDVHDRSVSLARLEPLQIGGIYPAHREDRLLVQLNEVPQQLIDSLLLVEDRHFYTHHGVSPRSIARAFWVNMRSGRVVQGGSTLTQQLVKNFFLSSQRSLWRKGLEAIMAVLLELHFSKQEILEAYLNEVYLGQSGPRAVHGFGLASQYYFNTPLANLRTDQIALLVGLVKGPSYYDPWRHQGRANGRRNLVIELMREHGVIDDATADIAVAANLGVGDRYDRSRQTYPAYLDLVRRQLRRDYHEEDLNSKGLRIFTNFDPLVQWQAERSLQRQLKKITDKYRLPESGDESLQTAMVVTDVENGEVLAVIGGRRPRFAGFNRAVDAKRPVGSLLKPAVYLTALENAQQYQLSSLIDDSPVTVEGHDGSLWQPDNFSHESHGEVLLLTALAKSYNQATARLGMLLGLDNVVDTVHKLGLEEGVDAVPAMLLGAVDASMMDMTQMYQTIAAGGYYSPLRSIREVTAADGHPLRRYPLEVEKRFPDDVMHLLQYALQVVMRDGTARSSYQWLSGKLAVAGKTGTTDQQRDSWFAGFSGDRLAVVWMGRDDNGATPLTGSSGALRVWSDFMAQQAQQSLNFHRPENVVYEWVDMQTGKASAKRCEYAQQVPFIEGTQPKERGSCHARAGGLRQWFESLFE